MAPNAFQVYNDYASPERTYSSARAVVHYVTLGIDAPPLNDDDSDGVPDYVERVGDAADRALAYYESRGFRRRCRTTPAPTLGPTSTSPASRRGRWGRVPRAAGRGRRLRRRVEQPRPEPRAQLCQRLRDRRPRALPPRPVLVLRPRHRSRRSRPGSSRGPPPRSRRGSTRSWTISSRPSSCADGSRRPTGAWRPRATAPSSSGDGWTAEQPRLLPALLHATGGAAGRRRGASGPSPRPASASPASPFAERSTGSPSPSRRTGPTTSSPPAHVRRAALLAPLSVRYLRVALPRTGRSKLTVSFPAGGAGRRRRSSTGSRATSPARRRTRDGSRRASSTTAGRWRSPSRAASRTTAVLVLSNGGDRGVPYAVRAR